jgi:multiple sugar transport system ATP-binding protein
MGDRILVLKDGVLQQIDSPRNLYSNPHNVFVAGFIGSPAMNLFDATLVAEEGRLWVDTGDFRVPVPPERNAKYDGYVGKEIIFGMRPEHIHAAEYAPGKINAAPVHATVDVVELLGHNLHLYLDSGKNNFVATVDTRLAPQMGQQLDLVFDMDQLHLFDKTTELTIA